MSEHFVPSTSGTPPTDLIPRDVPDALLAEHHVLVRADNPFQRRARLLQALWREERRLPMGERRPGFPLGSRLPTTIAKHEGANLLTEAARKAARDELKKAKEGSGQKIEEDRLWANLLSSQPLAFSLFADLAQDLAVASRVFRRLWPERIAAVTEIGFEYSPGRGLAKYTADRTAFDVYVLHTTPGGGRGFVGIEVKYHEALTDEPAKHRSRYDQLTAEMLCFKPECVAALRRKPLEQIWRDHMLAGSMLLDTDAGWETGLYVFLYPKDNEACRAAVQLYGEHLTIPHTFEALTLEAVVDVIEAETAATWIRDLRGRYFAWDKIERLLIPA
jgi:hypothetical protein